jgi:glycerol-3-phosphate acyltransferase PlsY
MILFRMLASFLLGFIPFSLSIGKLKIKTDIHTVGDGNPGRTNALKALEATGGVRAVMRSL